MTTNSASNKKPLIIVASLVVLVLLVAVLLFTKPWTAFTSSTVDEALPGQTQSATSEETDTNADANSTGMTATAASDGPQTLSSGSFVSLDHETKGDASLVNAEGKNYVRFEDLAGSDGPDLKVVVTTTDLDPANMSKDDYVSLGDLKATHGNQNYELPADLDPKDVKKVIIWCEQFSSPFGVAEFTPAA